MQRDSEKYCRKGNDQRELKIKAKTGECQEKHKAAYGNTKNEGCAFSGKYQTFLYATQK
jgi:hypothetical protein